MTDPDRKPEESAGRNETGTWVLVGLMALIAVGGLAYGLAHPDIYTTDPPQTLTSAAERARSGRPM